MGPWEMLKRFLILTVIVSSNSAFTPRTVDVKGSVTLPCNGTISKDTPPQEYDVKWETEKNIPVARYQQGELTAGDWFKGRVNISKDDIGFGNFSLKISPVEYSDRDLYMCFWMGKHLADVKLEVLVPTEVSARLGEPATLPCYFQVDKTEEINIDTPHWEKDGQICGYWKKDGQTVLAFPSGLFDKRCGCENRCSMSVDRLRFGDLSMTISEVRHSDRGTYRCFSTEKTEKSIKPDEIILSTEVHNGTVVIHSGQSLWLQLYSSDPVRVVFQPNENSSTVPVCTVKRELADCVPQYQHRVSIQNRTLKLDSVTPLDGGVYRVIDHKTNETISSVTVHHTADPPATAGNTWLWVLLVLLVLLLVVVVVVKMKRCRLGTQTRDTSPHSMAYSGISQEDSGALRGGASLAPGQPVQENGEEEQLSAPVCESGDTGDTEDKRGPQPWNDGDS